MRRVRPSLFALVLLLVAACLQREAQVPGLPLPTQSRSGLPDGGQTQAAAFELHVTAALALRDAGDARAAAAAFEQAVEADPTNPRAAETLHAAGLSSEQAGDKGRARQTQELVVRGYAEWEHLDRAWFRIGMLAEDEGDFAGAEAAYEEMLGGFPDGEKTSAGLVNLGRLYERRGALELARGVYFKWAELNPQDPDRDWMLFHSAAILSKHGDRAAEVAALRDFLAGKPPGRIDGRVRWQAQARLDLVLDGGGGWRPDSGCCVDSPPRLCVGQECLPHL